MQWRNIGEGIKLIESNYNIVTGNKLKSNGECIKEKGDCEGNVIRNNDCGEKLILGFNHYIIIGVFGIISIILIRKRFKK